MLRIRSERFVESVETNGTSIAKVVAELDMDTAEDLPDVDGIDGCILSMGSIAWDISTGDFYALNSEGTWYKQDGSGAYTPETPDAEPTALTLNLGKGVENEPDITEKTTSEPDILDEPVFEKTAEPDITEDKLNETEPEEVTEIDEPVQDTEKR